MNGYAARASLRCDYLADFRKGYDPCSGNFSDDLCPMPLLLPNRMGLSACRKQSESPIELGGLEKFRRTEPVARTLIGIQEGSDGHSTYPRSCLRPVRRDH